MVGPAAHRRKEQQLVAGLQPVIGLDVVVADGEEREGPVLLELWMAGDDGRPRRLHGAAFGKVEVYLLPPGGFTIPGEEVDPDAHDDV